jgi:hypothetical protein
VTPPRAVAITISENAIANARRACARRELGGLDYIRNVRAAVETADQRVDAQPVISRLLSQAEARE